ncbi:MAG: TIGR04133 family radical SAM/SPASM protein [Treponema sp.]|nr:TIGR04133 family radical SAM/SPASM protein [Treponema sp.]
MRTKNNNRLSLGDKLKRNVFSIYRKGIAKKHELNYLFWECTLRCNLNCRHCGSDCLKSSGIKDMPLEDFTKVLDSIKSKNTSRNLAVAITGGEPLLRDDLEKAGLEIIKRGFSWGIVTNGLLLDESRFHSLRQSGLSSMSVSLDGLEEEHTYLRKNPKSFSTVVNAIDIMAAEHNTNPRAFIFDVITCVHHGNISILPKLRDFLIQKGVEQWRIFSIFPTGRAVNEDLSLTPEEYRNLMDFIYQTRTYRNSEGRGIHLNYSCEGYLGSYELKVRDFFFFCRAGINVGSVMCDGSISACLSVRAKDFIQGNIYSDDFMDVWNNCYQNMRDRSWTKKGMCAECKSWKWCMGNGLHLYEGMNYPPAHCNLDLLLLQD